MKIWLHTTGSLVKHEYPLYLNRFGQNILQLSQMLMRKSPINTPLTKRIRKKIKSTITILVNQKLNSQINMYLSVKHSILGETLVNVDMEPFNFNSLIELSKLSKNSPKVSYLPKSQYNKQYNKNNERNVAPICN